MENNPLENNGIKYNNDLEEKSFDWLKGGLAHNIANVLLIARMSISKGVVEHHIEALNQSKKIIKVIKEKVNDYELMSKLNELNAELERIDLQASEIDKNLINNIEKLETEIEKIIRAKQIK